jgi:hypothetical protein
MFLVLANTLGDCMPDVEYDGNLWFEAFIPLVLNVGLHYQHSHSA